MPRDHGEQVRCGAQTGSISNGLSSGRGPTQQRRSSSVHRVFRVHESGGIHCPISNSVRPEVHFNLVDMAIDSQTRPSLIRLKINQSKTDNLTIVDASMRLLKNVGQGLITFAA